MAVKDIISEMSIKWAIEKQKDIARINEIEIKSSRLNDFIKRMRQGERRMPEHPSMLDLTLTFQDYRRYLRLAAESLKMGRINDSCIVAYGKRDDVKRSWLWINRAASFREHASNLLKQVTEKNHASKN